MPASALSILTGMKKRLDQIAEFGANAKAAGNNAAMSLGKLDNMYGGAISSWMSLIYEELQKAGSMWRDFNDTIIKDTRTIGLTIKDTAAYQRSVMEDSKALTYQYGIAASEVMKFQSNLAQATGRAQLLNEQERRNMAAMNKLLGPETTNATIKAFDELGGSVETATAHAAQTYEVAKRFGLDASQASATFAKNLKMANTYNFSGGIQGITKMTLLSQKLKFNMESIARTADKFSSIEGAIENSAKLQMLGGNLGAMFSNPMDAMYEALNDIEGFTNRIVSGMSQRGKFNKATGVVELSPQDKMLIKEQAEALGMSREELTNMVTQSTKNKQIESELRGTFTEEQKAYVTSQAKYDADTGKHYIERFNSATEQMEKVFTDELTADTVKELQNIAAPEEQMRGDVSDIKRLLMDKFDKDAKWLVTQREREKGMREGLSIAEGQVIDKPMNWYGDSLNGISTGSNIFNSAWKFITDGGWGTAISLASIIPAYYGIRSTVRGLGNGSKLRAWGAKAAKNANGAGGVSSGGGSRLGGPPGIRHYSKGALAQAKNAGYSIEADKSGQQHFVDEKTGKRVKKSFVEKEVKIKPKKVKALKSPKLKTPKLKGKLGTLATIGMMVGGTWLASKAATAGAGEQQTETTPEEGGIIEELKKHTALLEKIAGTKVETLIGTGEGENEEGGGFGVSDALTMGIYTKTGQNLVGKGISAGLKTSAGQVVGKGLKAGGEAIAKKAGGKMASKLLAKGMAAGPLGWASMGVDALNMGLQATGVVEAGGTADKMMNIGSTALQGAAIGSMIGTAIPGIGNIVGGAVGGAIGTVYGVVDQYGDEIKDWAGKKVDQAKEFLFGTKEEEAMSDADKVQQAFETSKIGATGIEDPALMQKAALATIGIHDLLVSKWNIDSGKYANGAEKKEGLLSNVGSLLTAPFRAGTSLIGGATSLIADGVSSLFGSSEKAEEGGETLSSALFNINDIITKGYETGFPIYNVNGASRMPEVKSSGILGNLIKSTVLASPIGMIGTLISNPELFGGKTEDIPQGPPEINLNVSGTIKLDGGSSSADIDVRKLLNDKQFMDKLTTLISENFQKNATMGVGRDMNNPARSNIGNTDVTSNRRR